MTLDLPAAECQGCAERGGFLESLKIKVLDSATPQEADVATMKRVYLDHNAGSPLRREALAALQSAHGRLAGNPSSPHAEGQAARHALEDARETVARAAGARPEEIVFTSGGTEADNAALRGVVRAARAAGARTVHVVTSAVEHPAVLETARSLRSEGADLTVLPVDGRGVVDPDAVARVLDARGATLVSVMHANNETGVVQPVGEIAEVCRSRGVTFHTDAVQSAGKLRLDPALGADLVSLGSHKVGGPAGVGALVVRGGTPFAALLEGGAQEGRRRAGTEPVALAAAFAAAIRAAVEELPIAAPRLEALRATIEDGLAGIDAGRVLHGAGAPRLPNTTHAFLRRAPGRILVLQLDRLGFAVSTGSACSTGSSRPSHVIAAMGRPGPEAADSLRVSTGPETTAGDVEAFLLALAEAVARLEPAGAARGAGTRPAAVPGGPS